MGIMTRLYHRSGGLSDNPYKQLFLDMGENIHIHYRDLRIEMSVPEFLEFAEIFNKCEPMVRGKIDDGYQDGVLPNTNETNTLTTISHIAPLQHPVKYNANRISIEENVDGYHIHFRNYKLLFDKKSFDNILQAMNDVVERRGCQRSLDELLHLITYNDLEYRLIEVSRDTSTRSALVEVERKYFGKLRKVFKALGYSYTEETGGGGLFCGENMEICARIGKGKIPSTVSVIPSAPYVLLMDYLTARKGEITPKELNLLKLQVLNAFGMVRVGENPYINLDFHSFLVNPNDKTVIFQTTTLRHTGNSVREYEAFSSFLHGLNLHSVKPGKIIFSEDENKEISDTFQKYIAENVASQPCVSKIYMLGSSTRSKMGKYEVPYIYSDLAKLASDFDILVEIDDRYPIPEHWQKKYYWKKAGSDYYHLGDLPHKIESPYITEYRYVNYFGHLIEAFLFSPSGGDANAKDKLLEEFKAKLIYAKSDSSPEKKNNAVNWLEGVAALMRDTYGLVAPVVSEISVSGHNKVYKVEVGDGGIYAVKIYHSSNFTSAKAGIKAAHIKYESDILSRLEQCEVPVITACCDSKKRYIHDVGSLKAMVFRYIDGSAFDYGKEQIACSADILSRLHRYLPPDAVSARDFDYSAYLAFWLARLDALRAEQRFTECVSDVGGFVEIGRQIQLWFDQAPQWQELIWVHGHGDVNPMNYIYRDNSAFLFDFQAARFMPRLGDIADGMIEFGFYGGVLVAERMEDFLRCYEVKYPLTDIERKHLDSFLLVSCMVKMLIMLQNNIYYSYKVNSLRMKALRDLCSRLSANAIG